MESPKESTGKWLEIISSATWLKRRPIYTIKYISNYLATNWKYNFEKNAVYHNNTKYKLYLMKVI